MFGNIFLSIMIAGISFLPIVFWGYTFSYIDPRLASRKRFILGVLAGVVSVVPVLYFDSILSFFSLEKLNVFFLAHDFQGVQGLFGLNASLGMLLAGIFLLAIIAGMWIQHGNVNWKIFLRSFFIFFGTFFLISLLFGGLNILFEMFPKANTQISGVAFGDFVFDSFKLVIFYYLLVALLEEASKHFHFLSTGILSVTDVKVGVLYAIFVALGFSFIENILYFYGLYQSVGFSKELVKVYFFRSSFALIVHVLCSSVLAYFFTSAYIVERRFLTLGYLKVFFTGICISILLHAVFDIGLSLGFSIIMFLYFIGGYLYVTSIFYKDTELQPKSEKAYEMDRG